MTSWVFFRLFVLSYCFNGSGKRSPLKILCEKEKNAGYSKYRLFPNIFFTIMVRIHILSRVYIVVCKWFQVGHR